MFICKYKIKCLHSSQMWLNFVIFHRSGLVKLTKLHTLNLSTNNLTTLEGAGLDKLTRLQCLSVENNRISSLAGLGHVTSLLELYIGNNSIKNIREIFQLKVRVTGFKAKFIIEPLFYWTTAHRYTREIPEPAPFLSRHGAQIGGIRVFPNNCDSPGAYVLQSEHESKHVWNAKWRVKIVDAFCLRMFPLVWSVKPKYPQFEPHAVADDAIAWGGIQGQGSPLYICDRATSTLYFCDCEWLVNRAIFMQSPYHEP